ncbi:MAG: AI-2E family transporter [Deltaproteobacteria bacterium]|nr:AI-2E family transporter [Deltaproteobacteria bacterium]
MTSEPTNETNVPAPVEIRIGVEQHQEPPLRMQRRAFLVVFAALGAVLGIWFLRPFAPPLVFAAVFAVLLWPVHDWFQRRMGAGPVLAATGAVIVAHLTVLLPFTVVATFTIQQLTGLIQRGIIDTVEMETYLIRIEALIHETFSTDVDIIGFVVSQWQKIAAESTRVISGILGGFAILLFQYIIAVVFVFYLLIRGQALVNLVVEISPLGSDVNRRILDRFGETSRAVLWGTLVTITAQGFIGTLGLIFGGVENAVLWGVVMTFAALVPVFGTTLVWGPACLYMFMNGHVGSGIVILVFGAIASTIDNIIRPLIVGGATTVPTLWILIAILGGIVTLGPMGVILGPALLAVFVECIDIYREEFLGYPRKRPRAGPRFRDLSVPDGRIPDLKKLKPNPAPAAEETPGSEAAAK